MYIRIIVFTLLFCFTTPLSIHAFGVDEKLPSATLESRAISIFKVTRCMVCSGESIHESQSTFASEMRALIRHNIMRGMTNEEILDNLKKRYGDQILNITPFNKSTLLLWIAPIFIAVIIASAMLLKLASSNQKKYENENYNP